MKNKYSVEGNIVTIYVKGRGEILKTQISTNKLEKAKKFPNTWMARWCPSRESFYVGGHAPAGQKPKTVLLHRWILGVYANASDYEVDHFDNNPMNNKDENLRLVSRSENLQNRTLQNNNSSGFRGVSFHKRRGKWQASVTENKKRIYLGLFDTPEEASLEVERWRGENYPFSKEAHLLKRGEIEND